MTKEIYKYLKIPYEVSECKNICSTAKLLYGRLLLLEYKNGYIHASNNYLATIFNMSERSITRLLGSLSENNFITIVGRDNFHRKIINIKNNVDNKYIWFYISKDEYYKDKDGHMKNNPSFLVPEYLKFYLINILLIPILKLLLKEYLKALLIKKDIDKNYIHVTELNGCNLNEDIFEKIIDYDKDDVILWHGKRCESNPYSDDEINELEELLSEFK